MLSIGGIVGVFICVFGGYLLAGGKMDIIVHALPFEFMIIGGSAACTLLVANSGAVAGKVGKDLGRVLSGPRWKKQDYQDLLALLFQLTKLARTKGVLALEPHIEKPHDSDLFNKYPKIVADHHAVDMICDTLRMVGLNLDDPHQVEDALERALKKHHDETLSAAKALTTVGDALPALGIVAAVMGVIKTMASIDQPPAILGKLIGGALVGTFLGVLLAYGVVGPLAARIKQIHEEDARFYSIIRAVIVSYLHGNAPQVAIEMGRQTVPSPIQPSFAELEQALAVP
jgi:chemotaxis protein MotA